MGSVQKKRPAALIKQPGRETPTPLFPVWDGRRRLLAEFHSHSFNIGIFLILSVL
jgi:hypothetical protein